MSDIDLAIQEIKRAEAGKYEPTLSDGLRWERLGLGRVVFRAGKATFIR